MPLCGKKWFQSDIFCCCGGNATKFGMWLYIKGIQVKFVVGSGLMFFEGVMPLCVKKWFPSDVFCCCEGNQPYLVCGFTSVEYRSSS